MAKDPYKYFRIEARELLEGLTQGVLALQQRPSDRETLARLLRLAHTLKGASRVVKLAAIGTAAHTMEDVLVPHRVSGEAVSAGAAQVLFGLIDVVTSEVNAIGSGGPTGQSPPPASPPAVPPPLRDGGPAAAAARPSPVAAGPAVPIRPVTPPPAKAAPTLQIADTVRVEIAEVDSILSSLSEAAAQVAALRQGSRAGARIRELVSALDQALGAVSREDISGSNGGALEHARAVLAELAATAAQADRPLATGVERVERELGQVRDKASQLRLLPAQTIFAPLSRAATDAAQTLGKRVELVSSGGETRLEAHVLSRVRAALLHVVRNAVAHGIEPENDRLATGKPLTGRIELRAQRRGNAVTFLCRDDGRGIDWERVRQRAVERGLCPPEQAAALDPERMAQLLLAGGLSTSVEVDEVSGRGVGLTVLDEVVRELRGTLAIESQPGAGASFELTIPISLSALTAIALETGGHKVWLPLEAVKHVVRVQGGSIVRSSEGQSIVHEDEAVPFVTLARILDLPGSSEMTVCSTAIVEADGRRAAVGADRLGEVATIVVRPIPAVAGAPALIGGASLDIDGNPVLVLSAEGLVEAVTVARGIRDEAPRKTTRRPILVIDDSLTTRMLEQSILEAAGYEVDTAVSAEDALKKASDRQYGLFLVDVEMPGMSGFEFVAHTRSDPSFRDIPSILVTSLSSPEHRRRGAEVGAYAYMVKGEYDEGRLRQLIRSVIG
jgi:two-component system, chemotaxis family, sensor kinase CheA